MKLTAKIKGNTLPEVLIALAILTVASSLASIIYLNIQKSNLPFFKLKAIELAEKEIFESKNALQFSDDIKNENGFTVKKEFSSVTNYADCVNLKVTVLSQNKRIIELNHIIYTGR